MSSVDNRVVNMQFNNSKFESGISTTLASLSKLKDGLNLDNAAKSIQGLTKAGDNFTLGVMGSAIDGIQAKFSTLAAAGAVALGNLAATAAQRGAEIIKSLTLDPITEGFDQYQDKMQSVMMLETSLGKGAQGQIEATMKDLNNYAKLTIYNVSDMNSALGQMVSQGVSLGDASTAIKGFGNAAAAAGVNTNVFSSQLQTALLPALALGKLQGQNWMQLRQSGIATVAFKDALKAAANQQGLNIKTEADFQDALTQGSISTSIMIAALKNMATNKSLLDAATQFHTFREVSSAVSEGVVSDWSDFWESFLGNEDQATPYLTALGNTLTGVEDKFDTFLISVGTNFNKFGGMKAGIDLVKTAWNDLGSILAPIGKAFKDVFPTNFGVTLANIAKYLDNLFKSFKVGSDTAKGLEGTFKGIFAIFDIAGQIIGGLVRYFASMFTLMTGGAGVVTRVTGNFGDFVAMIDKWLKNTGAIGKFFDSIAAGRTAVIGPLIDFVGRLVNAFTALVHGDVPGFFKTLQGSLGALAPLGDYIASKFKAVADLFDKLGVTLQKLGPVGQFFATVFGTIGAIFGQAGNGVTGFSDGLDKLGGFLKPVADWANDAANAIKAFWEALSSKVADTGNASLKTAADTGDRISQIANGITTAWKLVAAALAAAFAWIQPVFSAIGDSFDWAWGKIKQLTQGLTAQDAASLVATGFFAAFLAGASKFTKNLNRILDPIAETAENLGKTSGRFDKILQSIASAITNFGKSLKTKANAELIMNIAIALGVLAAAALVLSQIPAQKLAVAMGTLVTAMGSLVTMIAVLNKNLTGDSALGSTKLVALGVSLTLMSGAMLTLAGAVAILGALSLPQLAQGMSGLAVGMGLMVTAILVMSKNTEGTLTGAAAIYTMASAMLIMSGAILAMSLIGPDKLAVGLAGLATVMAIMVISVQELAKNTAGSLAAAAAIYVIAQSILVMSAALAVMGALGPDKLAVALAGLAGSMLIMLAAVKELGASSKDAVVGAAAMAVIAGAMLVLSSALAVMGNLGNPVQALTVLAASLLILVVSLNAVEDALPGAAALLVVAAALAVFAPVLAALGVLPWQVLALGLAAVAVSLGIFIAAGYAAIAAAPGLLALSVALTAFGVAVALMGVAFLAVGSGMLGFAQGMAILATVGTAGVAAITAILAAVIGLIPEFATQIGLGIVAIAKVITNAAPVFFNAFIVLMDNLLNAINVEAPKLITTVGTLLTDLLNMLAANVPKWADAGLKLLIGLLNAIANNIGKVVTAAANVIANFINGIANNLGKIISAGTNLLISFINGVSNNMVKVADAAEKAVINFINGVANSIRSNQGALNAAGANLAGAIVDGLTGGLGSAIGTVVQKAKDLAGSALSAAKKLLGIHSPSRAFYEVGSFSGQGLSNALEDQAKPVSASAETMATAALNKVKDTMSQLSDAIDQNVDINPTITPVLDLSGVQKDSTKLSGMLTPAKISTTGTYASASATANQIDAVQAQRVSTDADGSIRQNGSSVTFIQNNNSPKALSTAEVYRQTNNLISKVKKGLPTNADAG